MEVTDWVSVLAGILVPPLGLALAILLKRVETVLENRYGIEFEEKQMRTMHSAIMTGVRSGLARGMSPHDAMSHGIEWAKRRGAPDAIDWFQPTLEELQEIAHSKFREAMPEGFTWDGAQAK